MELLSIKHGQRQELHSLVNADANASGDGDVSAVDANMSSPEVGTTSSDGLGVLVGVVDNLLDSAGKILDAYGSSCCLFDCR